LTWRLAAALGALVLLAIGVDTILASGNQKGSITVAGSSNIDADGNLIERRIDLISSVARFEASEDWSIGDDGLTSGFLDAVLDENRVMRIAPGTPGESSCPDLSVANGCAVLADVIGNAVVWFMVLPQTNGTVQLPPIIDLQDGYAVFASGLRIPYPPIIERDPDSCDDQDISSFSDFLRRFGPNSVSIVDLSAQQVTAVLCGEEYVPPSSDRYDGSLEARIDVEPSTSVVASTPSSSEPES
jgi:hypothetical protein